MTNIVLKTEGLTKKYGNFTAVDNLSLEIHEGEVFGFLGPNGAGKTTSIQMMCGLLSANEGVVTVRGKAISNGDPEVKSRIGVCPQEIVIWERLTCLEQLKFMGEMYGIKGSLAESRGEKLLEDLDLHDKRNSQGMTLSGGMKRRLNLALALVHDPEIVILDEPEAGLDPQSRIKVRDFIKSLARKKTIILTTHNMDEADRVVDRLAIIDHGKLLVLDTPEDLKRSIGKGDVVEINVGGKLSSEKKAEEVLKEIASEVNFDKSSNLLIIRALNAVNLLPKILLKLDHLKIEAKDLRIRENTLEDVFIQLTGRGLRE